MREITKFVTSEDEIEEEELPNETVKRGKKKRCSVGLYEFSIFGGSKLTLLSEGVKSYTLLQLLVSGSKFAD
jgi:hypothetical protein